MMQWKLSVVVSVMCGMLVMGQSITVTSPNGGENWEQGSTHNITWVTSGISSGTYQVTLWQDGISRGVVATGLPYTCHAHEWTVGELANAPNAVPGPGYTIKVRLQGEQENDFSNAPFSITVPSPAARSIEVTSPNGGESWEQGSTHNIKWVTSGISSGTYQVTLWKGGVSRGVVATGLPYTCHAHEWTVGELANAPNADSGPGYTIKVRLQGEQENDFSNGPFTIQPRFRVVIPDGGETWVLGRDQEIRGIAYNYNGKLRLALYKRKNRLGLIADNLSPGSGVFAYNWKVGTLLNQQVVPAGNDYYVKVESHDGRYADLSGDFFSIQLKTLNPGIAAKPGGSDYNAILEAKYTRIVDPQVYYRFRNVKTRTHNGRKIFCFGTYPQSPIKRPISSLYGPVLSGDQLEKRDAPPKQNPDRELYFKYLPDYTRISISGKHAVFKPQTRQLVVTAFMESSLRALALWIRTDNGKEYERSDVAGDSTDLLTFTFDLEMDTQRGAIQPVFKGIEREFKNGITNLGPHWEAAKSRIVNAISSLMNGASARTYLRNLITSPVYEELGPGKWIQDFEIVDETNLKIRFKNI